MSEPLSGKDVKTIIRKSLAFFEERFGIDTRPFRPVIKSGDILGSIDGDHRLAVDPTWPTIETELPPDKAGIIRFIFNFTRRRITNSEMREGLGLIAKETGWSARRIADEFGFPYVTVYRNMPREYVRSYRREGQEEEPPQAQEEGAEIDTDSIHDRGPLEEPIVMPDVPIIDREEKETSKFVEVIVEVEADPVIEKTVEETAKEVFKKYPDASKAYVTEALTRAHDITKQEAEEIGEASRPEVQTSRTTLVGLTCPVCGTWKPKQVLQRAINNVRKRNPELAALVEAELEKQGYKL